MPSMAGVGQSWPFNGCWAVLAPLPLLQTAGKVFNLCARFSGEFYSTLLLLSSVSQPKSGVHNPPESVQPRQEVCTGVRSMHSVLKATS